MSEQTPGRHRKRRWFRSLRREVDLFRHGALRAQAIDDEFDEINELRITALEEIIAARWPRSIAVRRRLARDIRASVAHVQGDTFAERRTETIGTGWITPRGQR